jgi:hypothetical protein
LSSSISSLHNLPCRDSSNTVRVDSKIIHFSRAVIPDTAKSWVASSSSAGETRRPKEILKFGGILFVVTINQQQAIRPIDHVQFVPQTAVNMLLSPPISASAKILLNKGPAGLSEPASLRQFVAESMFWKESFTVFSR